MMLLEQDKTETQSDLDASVKRAEAAAEAFWAKWGPQLSVTPAPQNTPPAAPKKRRSGKKRGNGK